MDAEKVAVDLADILDFAYCPLRVWWRSAAAPPAGELPTGQRRERRTGEQLLALVVRQCLSVTNRHHPAGGAGEALGLVWKALLARWGLSDLARDLVTYAQRRNDLLARFAPGGDLRKAGGQAYLRPTWTRAWQEQAERSGLRDLARAIDARQERAGLAAIALPDGELARAPLGLAEVFAISQDILRRLELPDPDRIQGVGIPLVVELLAHRLHLTADLVLADGERRLRGRPAKAGGPRRAQKAIYELHLYEEEPPLAVSLSRDVRVLALGQARPAGERAIEPGQGVEVRVRHLRSGAVQSFFPRAGEGLDILEALARTTTSSIRAGAFLPRMVCGWRACGDCDYRALCFSDPGVLEAFNPPLLAQIQDSQALYQALQSLLARSAPPEQVLGSFLAWMTAHPGCTLETAGQMLATLRGDA